MAEQEEKQKTEESEDEKEDKDIKEISEEVEEIKDEKAVELEEPDEEEKKEIEKLKKVKDETEIASEKKDEFPDWAAKTKIGKKIKNGEIKNIDEILDDNIKILEPQIVDSLLDLETDYIAIGQAKGKFGGGKRRIWRQTQKKTAEGNTPTFSCMAVIGDKDGHVGVGYGRAKETLPAREKAIRNAKLNVIKIERACSSFDCSCSEKHTIPIKTEGKAGSIRIILYPAPQGTGLVVGDELKKVLRLAGIKDIYGKTFGKTRTTINMIKACVDALKNAKLEK